MHVALVQLDQLDKIFKVLGTLLFDFREAIVIFIFLSVAELITIHHYCFRSSHPRKVANTCKSSTLATRPTAHSRS